MKKRNKDRWLWYVARENEIFLDLDSKRALTRALSVVRRCLLVKPGRKGSWNELPVRAAYVYPSLTPDHFHMVLVLDNEVSFYLRVAWALWMGSDRLRAAYVMERFRWLPDFPPTLFEEVHGYIPSDLFSVPVGSVRWRIHDDLCSCKEKHKADAVTSKCPALRRILGSQCAADYFPRNRDKKKRGPFRLQWGKVDLRKLRAWK